ncbi:MAG: hypothetical protein ACLVJ8_09310, partial [Ruthenibacterium lactatiformans]
GYIFRVPFSSYSFLSFRKHSEAAIKTATTKVSAASMTALFRAGTWFLQTYSFLLLISSEE